MRALLLESPGRVVFHQHRPAPTDAPTDDSILVRVAACGVCGSDLPRGFDSGGAYRYPLVLGHEFSGVVEEDGSGFSRGERVAVFPLIPKPGEKAYLTGDYAQTTNYDYFGSRRDGGMQELLRVPAQNLFRLPEAVKLLHAACTEPAAVALHGVRKLHLQAGDVALVIGAGPIGNLTAQWLRLLGASRVLVSDIDPAKLELAATMGFEPVDARAHDPVKRVLELTAGEGAARVVEACGLPATFLQAIQCAATFGEIVFMGNLHGEFRIGSRDFSRILRRELTIHGTWNSKVVPRDDDDWSTVLRHMDRELQIAPLITHTPTLEEGPEVFTRLREGRGNHHKVIFRVTPELCS